MKVGYTSFINNRVLKALRMIFWYARRIINTFEEFRDSHTASLRTNHEKIKIYKKLIKLILDNVF